MVLLELHVDESGEVAAYLVAVGDGVVGFVEVERVVECGCGKLQSQLPRQTVERQHVLGVVVGYGASEAYVLQTHVA